MEPQRESGEITLKVFKFLYETLKYGDSDYKVSDRK